METNDHRELMQRHIDLMRFGEVLLNTAFREWCDRTLGTDTKVLSAFTPVGYNFILGDNRKDIILFQYFDILSVYLDRIGQYAKLPISLKITIIMQAHPQRTYSQPKIEVITKGIGEIV